MCLCARLSQMEDFNGTIHSEGFVDWFLSQNGDKAPGVVVARIAEYAERINVDGFELACVITAGVDPTENPPLACALINCCSDALKFRSRDLPPRNYVEIIERVSPSLVTIADYANSVKATGGYYDKYVTFFRTLKQVLIENDVDVSSISVLSSE